MVVEALDKVMQGAEMHRSTLASALGAVLELEFAVLVGSRAMGTAHQQSDWDIALQWSHRLDWLTVLAKTETLRHHLALTLGVDPGAIDLIDLRRANLTMRASVAEEGIPLVGAEALPWAHFLSRTWRDLEDFYWDKRGAGAAEGGGSEKRPQPGQLATDLHPHSPAMGQEDGAEWTAAVGSQPPVLLPRRFPNAA